MVTPQQLKQIFPQATSKNIDLFLPHLNKYMLEYGINTPVRQAAFLAQIGHESGQLRYVEEIASGKAYEGRRDLGNVYKGDGVKFKGRGLIQITGRGNYKQVSEAFGIDLLANPELLASPEYAAMSACWWWHNRGLNDLADLNTINSFKKITRIINGGYNGYNDRLKLWNNAKRVLIQE
ncbi:putative chitinase [Dysgonomonas sp. PH5-45]|uniref:glycoside hydrolase family 19 protein n=1 Tax=unclassified Dysgonomonas TaxID=2630389 RepID=UPI0024768D06|nr:MULTISPECIES: glycoside hydrolase family 19 protein [unclassified Dysgonomonas]MDH6355485.1 putative chitinase [Dysgonomonas sp. PH5-45]MDH6388381.1 putative chitinase [Dysgonomonas sp. PH5-37]